MGKGFVDVLNTGSHHELDIPPYMIQMELDFQGIKLPLCKNYKTVSAEGNDPDTPCVYPVSFNKKTGNVDFATYYPMGKSKWEQSLEDKKQKSSFYLFAIIGAIVAVLLFIGIVAL